MSKQRQSNDDGFGFRAIYDAVLSDSERAWTLEALAEATGQDAGSRTRVSNAASMCVRKGLLERVSSGVYRLADQAAERAIGRGDVLEVIKATDGRLLLADNDGEVYVARRLNMEEVL